VWLLLSTTDDIPAFWALKGLQPRGLGPWEVISPDALIFGVGWEHRLEGGHTSTDMRLPDGRPLRAREVRGVLNRISFIPSSSLLLVQPRDRDYVAQELQAFFLSWLHSLPVPVMNRPSSLGLSGRLRHISEWIWLASKAGLPIPAYRQTSGEPPRFWDVQVRCDAPGVPTTAVVVAGGVVTGPPVPEHIRAGCLHLSRLVQAELLGVDFTVDLDGTWTFAGVSTRPDFRLGGEPLLDALASALTRCPDNDT